MQTPTELKLGHAHERRCEPNRLEQHVVARHEAQQHDGARRGGHHGSQKPERTPALVDRVFGEFASSRNLSRYEGVLAGEEELFR
jgi:hypothetical protein